MRQNTTLIAAAALLAAAPLAHADAVTDWNLRANELVVESKLGTPPAMRVMAITQAAVLLAVDASGGAPGVALDAAVAAANRATLAKLMPSVQASVDRAYVAVIAVLPEGRAKAAGIEAGERAAAAVLAARADDGAGASAAYRPHTTAGAYVPTAATAVPHWGQRKPWLMTSAAQFRPAPPPPLGSATWVRDYTEVKLLGARASAARSAEQTEIATFWEYSLPPIYHGVVQSVAGMPGRDVAQNARLFAAATQALDDALIAVFEAKYQYNFWRPVTAIRNGDVDGNPATESDASWTPLHDAPMHPEYPSGHAILAGAVGAVLQAELAGGAMPVLATSSPSAKGATRRWKSVDEFVLEVENARIYEGIHFRSAVEAGSAMGRRIGDLAVKRVLISRPD
jgi:PAP2 superfamily